MSITSKIRIARGVKANLPAPPNSFEIGRPYYCTDTHEMFVGTGINAAMTPVGASVDLSAYATLTDLTAETVRAEAAEGAFLPLAGGIMTGAISGAAGSYFALDDPSAPIGSPGWWLVDSTGTTGIYGQVAAGVQIYGSSVSFSGAGGFGISADATGFSIATGPSPSWGTPGQILMAVGFPYCSWTDSSVLASAIFASPTFTGTVSGITAAMVGADALGVATTAFATEVTNRNTAIGVETTRAEAAEALLATSSALSTEATARIAGDATTLASAKTYADADIATEVTNRNTAIAVETTRATAAEGLLAPKASPTFTGTVSGITAAMVGAPTTAAMTTAIGVETTRALAAEALLAPLASPTFTGTAAFTNITVSGTTSFAAGSIADAALATGFLPLAGGTMTGALEMTSGLALNWNADSGISRLGAASLAVGNGTAADFSGSIKATTFVCGNVVETSGGNAVINFDDTGHRTYWQMGSTNFPFQIANNNVTLGSAAPLQWSSTTSCGGTADTGISRVSAGITVFGNGTASDWTGGIRAAKVYVSRSNSTNYDFALDANLVGVNIANNLNFSWSPTTAATASADTNLSRISAGVMGVGTGANGSIAGSIQATGGFSLSSSGPATQGMSASGSTTQIRGAAVAISNSSGSGVTFTGAVLTSYRGVTCTGGGVPAEVGVVTISTASAAVAATTLLALPQAQFLYRVSAYLKITVATSTPVAGPITLTYADQDGVAQSIVMTLQNAAGAVTTVTGSTTTTPAMGQTLVYCTSGTAIKYAIGFSGTGTYEYTLKCEML